jgi:hypothetical protein
LAAGALALAPWAALAQEAPPPVSNTPATDAVGPRALQDFSLKGTVTRAADQPTTTPAPQKRQPQAQAQPTTADVARAVSTPANRTQPPRVRLTDRGSSGETVSAAATPEPQPRPERTTQPLRQSSAASSVTAALPKLGQDSDQASAAAPATAPTFAPEPESAGTLAPEHKLPILPWLLAALALGGGGAFLFWRNRGREAFAGGPKIDAFIAPAPAPAPGPATGPAPRSAPPPPAPESKAPAPAPSIPGLVSTRLRPWIDIGFHPLRCVLDKDKVTVDFEVELFNSGSAPARAVLIEGSLFNAGPAQDEEIGRFFANPVGQGERIAVIPPLNRVALRTQVTVPSDRVHAYEMADRKVFVPLIAFNALYGWSGGKGQTSASYLLGRDTKGEKMAPFRIDLGPRIFRGIAGRLLPAGIRQ